MDSGETTDQPCRNESELLGELATFVASPKDVGVLTLLVRRPGVGEREILTVGELDERVGLVGDTWIERGSSRSDTGQAHPDMQLNIMNSRVSYYLAFGDRVRQALAGDQLHLDLDLSLENLPVGTLLSFGRPHPIGGPTAAPDEMAPATAGPIEGAPVIVVTEQPHTGCAKFVARFGPEAMRFVNGSLGRPLRLRGLNARVVRPGTIREGDTVTVCRPA